jgi:O-antigen ligase
MDPETRPRGSLLTLLLTALAALPWLNPAAGGPSAAVEPWLVAAAACLAMWVLSEAELSRARVGGAVVLLAILAAVGGGAPPVLLALAGLIVVALSASVAASRTAMTAVIACAWLVAALVSSVLALAQYYGVAAELAPWVNPTAAGEAFANLRQRNQFATLTSIGVVVVLWQARNGTRLAPLLPALLLLVAANAASASRTGALQIGLVVALAWWWSRPVDRRMAAVCLTMVLGYALAAVLLPISLQNFTGVTVPNAFSRLAAADGCGSRAVLWSNVLHLIAQRPWLGWGWGELDFAHFATLYPAERFCDILDNAHNLPLHLAVELGVPVAVLLTGGFLLWVALQRPWRETDPTRRMAWSVVAVITLHSLLEYPLWYGPFQMAFGFSLGLLATQARTPDASPSGRGGRIVIGAPLAACLLFAAWDYHRVSQLYEAPEERSAFYSGQALPRPGDSWLFRDQLGFAQLSLIALTMENAGRMHALSMELLHYSPEPRVIESAIASAMLLHREDEALWLLARYRAAFPADYEQWSKAHGLRKPAPSGVRD